MMRIKTMVLGPAVALLMSIGIQLPAAQAETTVRGINATTSVVTTAKRYVGTHYCHGGNTPRCFDCSGFTQYVFKRYGKNLSHVAGVQYHQVRHIKKKQARPGDLVFFFSRGHAYHVGIYVGHGRVLHAPYRGTRVRVDKIWTKRVRFGRA